MNKNKAAEAAFCILIPFGVLYNIYCVANNKINMFCANNFISFVVKKLEEILKEK